MTGKYVEEALRFAYTNADYVIQQADEDIERSTLWIDRYKRDLEDAQERRSEAMDRKLEVRVALIEMGFDPEKEG